MQPSHTYANTGSGSLAKTLTPTDRPAETPSAIRDALTFGEDLLSQMHAAISHLEARLDTVLTPTPPNPATSGTAIGGSAPTPMCSHVRERLGSFNGNLSDALSRLNALRDRVEV